MQDVKIKYQIAGREIVGGENARHEIAGPQNAGHKNARFVNIEGNSS